MNLKARGEKEMMEQWRWHLDEGVHERSGEEGEDDILKTERGESCLVEK